MDPTQEQQLMAVGGLGVRSCRVVASRWMDGRKANGWRPKV